MSCTEGCVLQMHPKCFKRELTEQNIDLRKKKNIKHPTCVKPEPCVTPHCCAAMFEIWKNHVSGEETLVRVNVFVISFCKPECNAWVKYRFVTGNSDPEFSVLKVRVESGLTLIMTNPDPVVTRGQ
jgi:hypothetical protein